MKKSIILLLFLNNSIYNLYSMENSKPLTFVPSKPIEQQVISPIYSLFDMSKEAVDSELFKEFDKKLAQNIAYCIGDISINKCYKEKSILTLATERQHIFPHTYDIAKAAEILEDETKHPDNYPDKLSLQDVRIWKGAHFRLLDAQIGFLKDSHSVMKTVSSSSREFVKTYKPIASLSKTDLEDAYGKAAAFMTNYIKERAIAMGGNSGD
jgi:hypothetical protein